MQQHATNILNRHRSKLSGREILALEWTQDPEFEDWMQFIEENEYEMDEDDDDIKPTQLELTTQISGGDALRMLNILRCLFTEYADCA